MEKASQGVKNSSPENGHGHGHEERRSSVVQGGPWSTRSDIGFKLLQKSGWKEGTGLGASEQGRLEPLDVVVKHDKRGIGASKLPTAKKIYEAPKQRDADSSKAKQGLEVKSKQSKKTSKRLKKELAREKELQEQVFQRDFFREFWPENV